MCILAFLILFPQQTKADDSEITAKKLLEKLLIGKWLCVGASTGYSAIFIYHPNGSLVIDGEPIIEGYNNSINKNITWTVEYGFSVFENNKSVNYDGYWLERRHSNGTSSSSEIVKIDKQQFITVGTNGSITSCRTLEKH